MLSLSTEVNTSDGEAPLLLLVDDHLVLLRSQDDAQVDLAIRLATVHSHVRVLLVGIRHTIVAGSWACLSVEAVLSCVVLIIGVLLLLVEVFFVHGEVGGYLVATHLNGLSSFGSALLVVELWLKLHDFLQLKSEFLEEVDFLIIAILHVELLEFLHPGLAAGPVLRITDHEFILLLILDVFIILKISWTLSSEAHLLIALPVIVTFFVLTVNLIIIDCLHQLNVLCDCRIDLESDQWEHL